MELTEQTKEQIMAYCDCLMQIAFCLFSAGEKFITEAEYPLAQLYRQSQDYQKLAKQNKVTADIELQRFAKQQLRGFEKYQVGNLLKEIEKLHTVSERLFEGAIDSPKDFSPADTLSGFLQDTNRICRIMYYYANAGDWNTLDTMEKNIKKLQHKQNLPPELLDKFFLR